MVKGLFDALPDATPKEFVSPHSIKPWLAHVYTTMLLNYYIENIFKNDPNQKNCLTGEIKAPPASALKLLNIKL